VSRDADLHVPVQQADQDEISKFLFFEIAPREGTLLRLTHTTQELEEVAV
jgi:hypothetical protein